MAPKEIKKKLAKKIPLVQTTGWMGKRKGDQLNRLYSIVAVIQVMNRHINFDKNIGISIKTLMNKYDVSEQVKRSMGFPQMWEEEPLFFL